MPIAGLLVGGFASTASAQGGLRYGHISWQQTSSGVVEFTIQNVWRRSAYGDKCVSPVTERFVPCSGRGGAPGIGDLILELEGSTTFDPGDDSLPIGSPALMYLVTAVDVDANWILGLALDPVSLPRVDTTIEHVYADDVVYRAFTESCCRISALAEADTHLNDPVGSYRVETLVSVGAATVRDASPVGLLTPVVTCPIDDVCMFLLPTVEPNADGLAGAHTMFSAQLVTGPLTQPVTTTLPSPLTTTLPSPLTTTLPSPLTTTLPSPLTTTLPSPLTTTLPSPVGEPISNRVTSTVVLDFVVRLIDWIQRRSNAAGLSQRATRRDE